MKAICILGSPKSKASTSTILSEITRALKAHDMQIVLYQLSDLDIGYCHGCKSCDSTGECVQTDNMQKIIQDLFDSQLVILASPSYWGDAAGQMKVFIDRCTPFPIPILPEFRFVPQQRVLLLR